MRQDTSPLKPDSSEILRHGRLVGIPSFHSRLEFALQVRNAFFSDRPTAVCVELPTTLASEVIEAVKHLPNISMIGYGAPETTKQVFIPIDPADSIIESIRLALAFDIPVEFIDLPLGEAPPSLLGLPDEYALQGVSLSRFYQALAQADSLAPPLLTPDNRTESLPSPTNRERFMVWNLERVLRENPEGSILVTCGMAHWAPITQLLGKLGSYTPPANFPPSFAKIFNVHPDSIYRVLHEIPYVIGLYEQQRDRATRVYGTRDPSRAIFDFDRYTLLPEIFFKAHDQYRKMYRETLSLAQFRQLFQYARNLALTGSKLIPGLFEIVSATKNIFNDDYASIVFQMAAQYPWVDRDNKYPFIQLADNPQQVEGSVALRRHLPVEEGTPAKITLKRRPRELRPGAWKEAWGESTRGDIVSWPPEDVIFEDYMQFCRIKAKRFLKSRQILIQEFTTNFLDGIAIKETLQNWWRKKIFVKEERPLHGDVGPIVAIFAEDSSRAEFPWEFEWYAEHPHESDLCLYATAPEARIIGPRIAQIEVGGLLSIYPPVGFDQLYNPWNPYLFGRDFFHALDTYAQTRAEKLLVAGVFNATRQQKFITYIAAKPPRSQLTAFAEQRGHHIVFLPINTFSPGSIKKLRRLHVLKGRATRNYAGQYIFL